MRIARLFAALAAGTLLISPAVRGQDAKDDAAKQKEKDKAAKAKPPARSYSDDDLKKYKDKPKEGTEGQPGAEDSGAAEAPVPGQRRSREYGGYQKLPPPAAPPSGTQSQVVPQAPASDTTADDKSPEEADWRRRAAQARRPVQEAEANVRQIEGKIADLRDQLNPMSTKYVLGGNSTAGPGAIYEIEEQLRNLESELVGARAAVAEAQKTWQAFLEEARAGGASPAWLNP